MEIMRKWKTSECVEGCPVESALGFIGGKWKGVVLYHLLKEKKLRFGEIRKRLPAVTQRMLTKQLRELERDGFILRQVYPQVPPKVEYSLSVRGISLRGVIKALEEWGSSQK